MDSVASAPTPRPVETVLQRRLQAEWSLLAELVHLNPHRLSPPTADDCTFSLTLRATPARSLAGTLIEEHTLRLEYPLFFPAMPLALYLRTPVFHPNVHPDTGFVCLWDTHRAAHTAEDALHRTAAILGWKLFNLSPEHTMQPAAAELAPRLRQHLAQHLHAPTLRGVRGVELYPRTEPAAIRRRLS